MPLSVDTRDQLWRRACWSTDTAGALDEIARHAQTPKNIASAFSDLASELRTSSNVMLQAHAESKE